MNINLYARPSFKGVWQPLDNPEGFAQRLTQEGIPAETIMVTFDNYSSQKQLLTLPSGQTVKPKCTLLVNKKAVVAGNALNPDLKNTDLEESLFQAEHIRREYQKSVKA